MQAETIKQSSSDQPPSSSLQLSANKCSKWVLVGVIVLITFITFSVAMRNDFITISDDRVYVLENNDIARPIIEGIKYFFALHYLIGNYNPITMITYALEYHLFGLNPELYHLVNVVIHLLNVMLVFWFIYLLSGKKLEVAAITSLFFGIHPMHVESVVWIGELKDVLYSFFFIGGLITYYKYIESLRFKVQGSKSKVHYSLTFILFILSCLSKPAAVIFPIVLLLIDYYTKRKFDKNVWIEKVPFFIVTFILGIITIEAHQQVNLINKSFTILQSLLFAPYAMVNYIAKFILPINLSSFYPYPQVVNGHLPYIFYITPFIVLLLFYGVYLSFRYSRLIPFGVLFFFVNIALVLRVVPISYEIIADRYTYIPYIGLFFVIAMGFSRLYNSNERKLYVYKLPAIIVIIILAIVSSYLSYGRSKIWKNSETLWTDVLKKFPNDYKTLYTNGDILDFKGQNKEAMKLFNHAIELQPSYNLAYMKLANCYQAMHDYDNALKNIDISLKYNPNDYEALNTKGAILFEQGKYKEAMKFLTEAIKLKPSYSKPYFILAECYQAIHDYDNALKYINIALHFVPDDYKALHDKGFYLAEQGKYNEAIIFLEKAIQLKPDFTDAYFHLANCYDAMHDYDNALKIMDIILKYAPNDYNALNNKGFNLFNQGKYKDAIIFLKEAIQFNPNYCLTYMNLADCYHALQDYENELKNLNIALQFAPDDYKALNSKGYILYVQGKYKLAIELFKKTIQLKPDFSLTYMNLADCYNALHDYDNAIKIMDIGLKYNPNDYKAFNHKGYILFEEGKYKEAVKFLREAIQLKPDYSKPYFNLADCYRAMHDYDNVIFYCRKSLEFNPDNADTYKMLGWAYQNKGDKVSADVYYVKAKKLEKEKSK